MAIIIWFFPPFVQRQCEADSMFLFSIYILISVISFDVGSLGDRVWRNPL